MEQGIQPQPQQPINPIPSPVKKLNNKAIAIVVLAIVAIIIGFIILTKSSPVFTNQNNQPAIENKIYSVKEVLDLLSINTDYFKGQKIQLKAYKTNGVAGLGCNDYFILMDKEDADHYRQLFDEYMSKDTSETQRPAISTQIQNIPSLKTGETLGMNQNIFPTVYAVYGGHFNDASLSKNCLDGNKRFVIDRKIEELQTDSEAPPINQNTTNQSSVIAPPLFTDVRWQKVPFDPSKTMDFKMAYNDFKYIQEPTKRNEKFIQLPGHLWMTTIKNLSDSQLNDTRVKFQKYYDGTLKDSGWDWQQDLDSMNISFSGPAADGPLGSIWGYVKIQNEKLRLIGLGYQITDYTDVSNGGPIEIKCPCTLELKVFESDEASVNNFSL